MTNKTAEAVGRFIGMVLFQLVRMTVFVFAVWVAMAVIKQLGYTP